MPNFEILVYAFEVLAATISRIDPAHVSTKGRTQGPKGARRISSESWSPSRSTSRSNPPRAWASGHTLKKPNPSPYLSPRVRLRKMGLRHGLISGMFAVAFRVILVLARDSVNRMHRSQLERKPATAPCPPMSCTVLVAFADVVLGA